MIETKCHFKFIYLFIYLSIYLFIYLYFTNNLPNLQFVKKGRLAIHKIKVARLINVKSNFNVNFTKALKEIHLIFIHVTFITEMSLTLSSCVFKANVQN